MVRKIISEGVSQVLLVMIALVFIVAASAIVMMVSSNMDVSGYAILGIVNPGSNFKSLSGITLIILSIAALAFLAWRGKKLE